MLTTSLLLYLSLFSSKILESFLMTWLSLMLIWESYTNSSSVIIQLFSLYMDISYPLKAVSTMSEIYRAAWGLSSVLNSSRARSILGRSPTSTLPSPSQSWSLRNRRLERFSCNGALETGNLVSQLVIKSHKSWFGHTLKSKIIQCTSTDCLQSGQYSKCNNVSFKAKNSNIRTSIQNNAQVCIAA